jgi:hypothetical protein
MARQDFSRASVRRHG